MNLNAFIQRPILATVCSLILLLGGLIALPGLPIAQYPDLAPPQVTVAANYTGASAEVVESAVTTPLEQEINGVEGMKYITSTSSSDGSSGITVTFDPGRNLDAAILDIKNRVALAEPRLPPEVRATGVSISKNANALIIVYGLYAPKGGYDTFFLSNYADRYIKDALKRIPGVGKVEIFGERKFAMRLWLDPDRLAARGLTAPDVVRALQEQNVQVAAGQVGQPPQSGSQALQLSVRALGRLESAREFENIVLKTGPYGALVRLKDVGRAELGAENYSSTLRFNRKEAVGLGVYQLPQANALEVARQVREQMAKLSQRFPAGVQAPLVLDVSVPIGESLNEVINTLVGSIAIVIGVIYLFLQSGRSTLIPAITIPVSLLGTFLFLKLMGYSINTLTLFGLTLATGLVVDDAIIVIENIERLMREKGLAPLDAAREAMREVAGAVIATSLVLIAVFVPVAFFPGTTGILYRQFSVTLAFSIALSAFNALTFTPAWSAMLFSAGGHGKRGLLTPLWDAFNNGLERVKHVYEGILHGLVKARALVLAGFLLLLMATGLLTKIVPTGFVPAEDQDYFITAIQAPPGASLAYTERVIDKVAARMMKMPGVFGVFSVGGFSFAGNGPNKALLFTPLKPVSMRKAPELSQSALVNSIRGELMAMPEALVIPFEPPTISGVGNFGGFQFQILDESNGTLENLANVTGGVVGSAMKSPVLTGLYSSFTANDPQLRVTVDRERAQTLGVPLNDVFSTMQVFLGSVYVNDFDYLNRLYRVYIQADEPFRSEPDSIGRYYVRGDRSNAPGDTRQSMIPLSNLVDVERAYTPQVISHYNLFRSTEISGSAAPGRSTGEALQAMEAAAKPVLTQGMRFEWSGLALEEIESGRQALVLFALSAVFVFLVLAAQYESLLDPLVIMLAVPLAIFGALAAQWMRGLQNDVFCQIGLVMLIGLASKNAILIVEFANQERARGADVVTAAIRAAKTRFRPILMTSLAFILGILPLVFAEGAGSGARHALGTAVFGGMVVSTLLNLGLVPVLYVVLVRLEERIKARFRRNPSL